MEQGGAAQQPCNGRPVRLPDQHRRDRRAVRGIGGRSLAGGEAALGYECPLQGGMVEIDGTVDDADAHPRAYARAISLPADRCQHPLPVVELAAAGACIGREVEWIVERDDRRRKFVRNCSHRIHRNDAARRRNATISDSPKRIEPLDAFDGETVGDQIALEETERDWRSGCDQAASSSPIRMANAGPAAKAASASNMTKTIRPAAIT